MWKGQLMNFDDALQQKVTLIIPCFVHREVLIYAIRLLSSKLLRDLFAVAIHLPLLLLFRAFQNKFLCAPLESLGAPLQEMLHAALGWLVFGSKICWSYLAPDF